MVRNRQTFPTQLEYVTSGYAPGYRYLTLTLKDSAGNEYELQLSPAKVQTLIYACTDVVRQINNHPPLDWDRYPSQIYWPAVQVLWMRGPDSAVAKATA